MIIKYAVRAGWGYVVKAISDSGECAWFAQSGDCWDNLHVFGTRQMSEKALMEAAKYLADEVARALGCTSEPIFDKSVLPPEFPEPQAGL